MEAKLCFAMAGRTFNDAAMESLLSGAIKKLLSLMNLRLRALLHASIGCIPSFYRHETCGGLGWVADLLNPASRRETSQCILANDSFLDRLAPLLLTIDIFSLPVPGILILSVQ